MRDICIADCETDPFKYGRVPKPFLWGYYDGSMFVPFWGKNCTTRFVNYVKQKTIILFAHNGGKFDWHFVFKHFDPFTKVIIITGRIALFRIGNCELRDSFSILPFALEKYKKVDIDYAKFETDQRDKYKKEIIEYLRYDCKYLYELVNKFRETLGINLTIACTALKHWRKISKQKSPTTTSYFYDYLKPYYYGGRVECFEKGIIKKPFYYIDINSAYPFAMLSDHPYGDKFNVDNKLPKKTEDIKRCFVHIKAKSLGAFPYRTKHGLQFPCDNKVRDYFITGHELIAAKEANAVKIKKVVEVCTFYETVSFADFVNKFYSLKLQAKNDDRKDVYLFCKYLLNSLYGKFAADYRNYFEYQVIEKKYIQAAAQDGWIFNSILGDLALVQKPAEAGKFNFYNIAVSISITGAVRANLFRALKQVENPLYCDTDSIACRDIRNLNISKNLGQWSIVAKCTGGAIAGKKLYAFRKTDRKYITASKGVSLTARQIYRVAAGNIVKYEPISPTFSVQKPPCFTPRNVRMT